MKMNFWRCLIAILLGLLWYFSDFGLLTLQVVLYSLCCIPLLYQCNRANREINTQTEDIVEQTSYQEQTEVEFIGFKDETDAISSKAEPPLELQYPVVTNALLQVVECAYAQLVLPWYTVPESPASQPLHEALLKEINPVIARIIGLAVRFDLGSASVTCIRILTHHLRNAKQTERLPLFSTRDEEMKVLRDLSDTLVRNLLPESLRGPNLNHCLFKEIFAVKVLDLLVRWLSDPDNLNQLVVSQLDGGALSGVISVEELGESERETPPSSNESEDEEAGLGDSEDLQPNETKSKKKARTKLKEGWTRFVDRMKTKTKKKPKKNLMLSGPAKIPALLENNAMSSREGSIHSCLDSDAEDSDGERYTTSVQEEMIEFQLSYEMWRVGNWAVSITDVQVDGEELCFKVHIEEKENPENLQWDVRKTQSDILHFYSMWQDLSTLPQLSAVMNNDERELDDEFKEEARATLENFLQALVSDAQLGHTHIVFQFLCPLYRLMNEEEHYGGVWGLLSGLAYFLTPSQEEDQNGFQGEVKHDEGSPLTPPADVEDSEPAATESQDEHDEVTVEQLEVTNSADVPPSDIETPSIHKSAAMLFEDKSESDDDVLVQPGMSHSRVFSSTESLDKCFNKAKAVIHKMQSNNVLNRLFSNSEDTPLDAVDGRLNRRERPFRKAPSGVHWNKGREKVRDEPPSQPQMQRKELNQSNWEHLEATKAVLDLMKEIAGNSFIMSVIDAMLKPFMPVVKKRVHNFLKKMNPTEAQVASYIDNFREKHWPKESPQPEHLGWGEEEKKETRERAQQLIYSRYSNSLFCKKSDLETVFKIFQDTEENKKLVYMLLSYLLKKFLPGESTLNGIASLSMKDEF